MHLIVHYLGSIVIRLFVPAIIIVSDIIFIFLFDMIALNWHIYHLHSPLILGPQMDSLSDPTH
jgi:hypothetical protein